MLVLSRKQGEQVLIDDRITVTVLAVGEGRIRLGIDAPREIPILRGELSASEDWGSMPPSIPGQERYRGGVGWPLVGNREVSHELPSVVAEC